MTANVAKLFCVQCVTCVLQHCFCVTVCFCVTCEYGISGRRLEEGHGGNKGRKISAEIMKA